MCCLFGHEVTDFEESRPEMEAPDRDLSFLSPWDGLTEPRNDSKMELVFETYVFIGSVIFPQLIEVF